MKSGYGFITRSDTNEDVFVHWTAIIKKHKKKGRGLVRVGDAVQFDVVKGEKGTEAFKVSQTKGDFATDQRRGAHRMGSGRITSTKINTRNGDKKKEMKGADKRADGKSNGN